MRLIRQIRPIRLILFFLSALLVAGALVFIFSYFSKPASASWFDESWLYRQAITVTVSSSSSDISNLETLITVANTNTLVTNGKLQSSCQDLRFTSTSGKLLPYYIDSGCNSASTKIWVEADLVPKNTTTYTMYMYYGNPTALAESDASKFSLFNGLVGYWNMNEASANTCTGGVNDTCDVSVNSNNGAWNGNTANTTGKYSNGTSYDGTGDYINAGSFALNGSFTMTGWINVPASWTRDYPVLMSVRDNPTTKAADILARHSGVSNKARFQILTDGNWYAASSTTALSQGWHHVVAVYDSSAQQVKLYVDNVLNDTQPGPSSFSLTATLLMGYANGQVTNDYYPNDTMDELRIYNRVLSTDEVSQLYNTPGTIASTVNATVKPTTSFATEEQGPGPVGYWKFDDGTGTTAQDSTSGNNDGTLSGTTKPTWQTEDQCVSGKCLFFDGSTSNVTVAGAINGIRTISFWISPITTASTALIDFDGGTHKITTDASSVISATGFTSPTYYINGVQKTSPVLIANTWQHIEITTGTSFNSTSSLTIGRSSTTYLKGFLDDVKIYPYARTAAQVKSDYLAGKANAGTKQGTAAVLGSKPEDWLSNGLVGYWKMDESSGNITDSSGNSNTGTNTSTTVVAGKFGNGRSFNGSTSQVALASEMTNSTGSLSVWINTSAGGNNEVYSQGTSSGLDTSRIQFGVYSGKISLLVQVSTAVVLNVTTNSTFNNGAWHLVTWVVGSSSNQIYVDGQQQAVTYSTGSNTTQKWFSDVSGDTNTQEFGRLRISGTSYNWFNGTMDEIRIYNRALSPKEVSDLYNWAPGPVGYWKMDDKVSGDAKTLVDSSGYGRSGTTVDGSNNTGMSCQTTGKYGGGCSLDGTDDSISAGTDTAFQLTDAITVEAWVKNNSFRSDEHNAVAGKASAWTTNGYGISIYGTTPRFYAGVDQAVSSTTLNTGQWYHLVGTYDKSLASNNIKFYVNGVQTGAITQTAGILFPGSYNFNIGQVYASHYPLNGNIDEVKVYNYARTQKQIISDMNAGHPSVGSPVGSAVGYWKFDEGYGQTTNNSGNGGSTINGTLGANSGSSTDDPSWSNSGKFGKALSFDGGDYVSIPDNSNGALDFPGTGGWTTAAWIKTTSSSLQMVVAKDSNAAGGRGYNLYTDGGVVKGDFFQSDGNVTSVASTTSITDNAWHHIGWTYTYVTSGTSVVNIYVDGKLVKTASNVVGPIQNSVSDLRIGARTYSGAESYFTGLIDEPKIYSYTLTADEVKTEYNRGSSLQFGAAGTNSSYQPQAANQEYCVPGDSTSCAAPVGEWKFEERTGTSAYDTSGNGFTGTLGGDGAGTDLPTWKPGKIGGALSFDGSDDFVQVTDNNTLDLTSTSLTLEAWVKPNNLPTSGNLMSILEKYLSTDPWGGWDFRLYNNSGTQQLDFTYYDTTTTNRTTTYTGSLSTTQWSHIVAVHNASADTDTIYLNGAQVAQNTGRTLEIKGSTKDFTIGNFGTLSRYFNGKIDQVRIFNYARSAAQIAWDYNRGKPVGHWKMDECQGTTINDSSGNSNSGTWNGTGGGTQTSVGTCTGSANTAWKDGATGKRNSSLDFDGTDDYVNLGNTSSLNAGGLTEWSISTWFKPSTSTCSTHNNDEIITKWNSGYQYLLGYKNDNTCTITYAVRTGGTGAGGASKLVYSSTPVSDTSRWYHLAGVYNGSTLKLYIDGVENNSAAATGSINTGVSDNVIIGSYADLFAGQFITGAVDDLRIYNYALTATQIKDIMNEGAVRFGPSTGSP